MAESARLFMVPTLAFIVPIFAVIVIGLVRGHPPSRSTTAAAGHRHGRPAVGTEVVRVGVLGADRGGGDRQLGAAVPPAAAEEGEHTEVGLGLLLGLMLIGLGALIRRWDAVPQPGTTVLAQLTAGAISWQHALFYIIQIITLVLLSLAANTSFAGLPVLAGLLAHDNFLPHMFGLRADRRVFRYGVVVLADRPLRCCSSPSAVTPRRWCRCSRWGSSSALPSPRPGMVKSSGICNGRVAGLGWPAIVSGVGALLTFVVTIIELVSKFLAGAWLVAIVIPLLVLMFMAVAAGVRADRRRAPDRGRCRRPR